MNIENEGVLMTTIENVNITVYKIHKRICIFPIKKGEYKMGEKTIKYLENKLGIELSNFEMEKIKDGYYIIEYF